MNLKLLYLIIVTTNSSTSNINSMQNIMNGIVVLKNVLVQWLFAALLFEHFIFVWFDFNCWVCIPIAEYPCLVYSVSVYLYLVIFSGFTCWMLMLWQYFQALIVARRRTIFPTYNFLLFVLVCSWFLLLRCQKVLVERLAFFLHFRLYIMIVYVLFSLMYRLQT